jgi:hypothetical protein
MHNVFLEHNNLPRQITSATSQQFVAGSNPSGIPVVPLNGQASDEKSAKAKTSRWIRFQLWFNTYR